jgi:uncharacterized protein YraI
MEGITKYTVEAGSGGTIHVPSYMKIGAGFQTTLRFCVNNLEGCNVGITDDKDL